MVIGRTAKLKFGLSKFVRVTFGFFKSNKLHTSSIVALVEAPLNKIEIGLKLFCKNLTAYRSQL